MSKVDPTDFIDKRVFVKTNKKNYVGTLKTVREYSLEIGDYYVVHQHTDEKITARGEYGSYSHIIMHSGGSKEMLSIELNTLLGDPLGESSDYVAEITPPAWMQTFAQDSGDEDDGARRLMEHKARRLGQPFAGDEDDADGVPGRVIESSNYDSVIDTGLGLCD